MLKKSSIDQRETMDPAIIQPFINATITVCKTMAFTDIRAGAPYLKNEETAKGDVSGVIGMTGDCNGSLSVSFPQESILVLVSDMFGEEMPGVNDDIKDAVGEITNMISGRARQELETIGMSLDAAIPSVISGKDHSIKHITSYPISAVTFTLEKGEFLKKTDLEFTIEVCLEGKSRR